MDYNRGYFKGKTAVVTGGASGIGLALLEELLASDADRVVMADINEERLATESTRLEEQYSGKVKTILCNVTREEEVESLIAQAAEFFGGHVDLLFNNAGFGAGGSFDKNTNEDWDAAFALNFYGALYGMRAVIPLMKEQGGGQIANTISGVAFVPMPYQARYAATKCALLGLSLSLRAEYWDDNIKITPVTPGTTATHIFDGMKTPDNAQTPQAAASHILCGLVSNDRLIYGDVADTEVADLAYSSSPETQKRLDDHASEVARQRRSGNKSAF